MDAKTCPLCAEANDCALARDPAVGIAACWCAALEFPGELLARVPEDARGSRCICRRCVEKALRARRDVPLP